MADNLDFQLLDEEINLILSGQAPRTETGNASLLSIAGDLQYAPRPSFRANLRTHLRRIAMSTPSTTVTEERQSAIPYLIVRNAAMLIDFLKEVFGAEELLRVPRDDGLLMHVAVRIEDSYLELADSTAEFPPRPASLHVYIPNVDEVVSRAVAAGAQQLREILDQPYGDREGSVRDAFGNNWFIATHLGPSYRPVGLRAITTCLFPVGAAEFLRFVQSAFGAVPRDIHYGDDGKIAYSQFQVGNTVLSVSDAHDGWGPNPTGIHLYVDDVDATYARAIAAGAHGVREPEDQPYGERISTVRDPFGNDWFIAKQI